MCLCDFCLFVCVCVIFVCFACFVCVCVFICFVCVCVFCVVVCFVCVCVVNSSSSLESKIESRKTRPLLLLHDVNNLPLLLT